MITILSCITISQKCLLSLFSYADFPSISHPPRRAAQHLVIETSHPSPLGATKTASPFIGSKCFAVANKYLESNGKDRINWSI